MNKDARINGEIARARGALDRIKNITESFDVDTNFGDWGGLRERAAALGVAAAQLQSHAAVLLALDGRLTDD